MGNKIVDEQKRLIDENELETRFGIKKRTSQKWRLLGKGPKFYRLHGMVRYRISDIEAWIASCASDQTAA